MSLDYRTCFLSLTMDGPPQYVPHDLRAVSSELSPDAGPDDASEFPSSALLSPLDLIFTPASFRAIGV
jgi:hypothetical protein